MIIVMLAALALDAPMSPSEQVLADQCVAEGASKTECGCALEFAREKLTVRQIDLFAELTPMMAELPDLSTAAPETVAVAMAEAMQRAEEAGYTPDEIVEAMGLVMTNIEEVETSCADPEPGAAQ